MTARIGWLAIAIVALIGAPASAQEAPKKASPPAAAGAHAAPVLAKPPNPGIAVPQPEVLLLLVRSALIALDHANRTGNYSVLRELGGPGLQQHSSAQLSNVFASLRNQQIDLLPVAIVTPQLTQAPSISPEGLLQLVGFFPTQPRSIEFQIVYQPVNGQWKLFGLTVRLATPATSPPQASAPSSAPKAPQLEAKTDAKAAPPAAAPPAQPKKK